MSDTTRTRRDILRASGAALLAGLAGCSAPSLGSVTSPYPAPEPPEPNEAPAPGEYAERYRDAIDSVVLVETDRGQGTGFVYADSVVVTNAHVVGSARSVDVRFTDGRWATGEVLGRDRHSDLAAIAVEDVPGAATPLPLLDRDPVIGQRVVAIGNPYSLNGTLTTGVVSGIDRSIPAPTGFSIPDAIQTDAAVNPGNSGGPLLSMSGNVVGVVNSGGGDNIAFGISGPLTRRVIPNLIETGSYEHSYLGVSFDDVTPDVAQANDLDETRGLLVVDVVSGGPAAGRLQPSDGVRVVDGARVAVGGDVLLSIDGTALSTAEDLGSYLALQTSPGDTISLTIRRDGSEHTVDVTLGTRPNRT